MHCNPPTGVSNFQFSIFYVLSSWLGLFFEQLIVSYSYDKKNTVEFEGPQTYKVSATEPQTGPLK
jgi:hypothetical protein